MTTRHRPGRRRSFEDEQAFQQITQVLLESGMSSLTMPGIAKRLGITHQSLGSRFGSKSLMLHAYVNWMHSRYEESFQREIAEAATSLKRLWSVLILPIDSSITGCHSGIPAQWLVLNLELLREPDLHSLMFQQQEVIRQRLVDSIQNVIADGIITDVDPEFLAERLYTATLGGAMYWLFTRQSVDTTRMERACSAVLRPYLKNQNDLPDMH